METTTDEPLPHSLAIRQEVHVITQTLSWAHTTFTTHVTLGGEPTDTTQATDNHQGAGGLSDAQIGAIVGSVVGTFVLVVAILCCCCQRRPRPVRHNSRRSYASYSSSYMEGFPEPAPPPKGYWRRTPQPSPVQWPPPVAERVPERVPGGPKFPTYRANPIPNPRKPTRHVG
ncbi:hypothetical protein QQX98_009499 [Neonectria punicea]|uniref:Mid2 domain-containing protein n=1 Tax=Neonectria punicea TaxID=979145 RepID=A0ABR1GSD8_9HYPO